MIRTQGVAVGGTSACSRIIPLYYQSVRGKVVEELFRILPVLKSNHEFIRVSHDNRVAVRLLWTSFPVNAEVEDALEARIRQKWRDNRVVAWRIMVRILPGGQVPDCDPTLMFTEHELNFLRDDALQHGKTPPASLGDAVRLLAHPGGDCDPGLSGRLRRRKTSSTRGRHKAGCSVTLMATRPSLTESGA